MTTDALERTCGGDRGGHRCAAARVREVGEIRQGFHRLGGGGLIVEVVERAGLPSAPAWFWGLVINVEDLDAAAARIGPDGIGDVIDAVQPGRRIATVRAELGLGVPVALMTPVTVVPCIGRGPVCQAGRRETSWSWRCVGWSSAAPSPQCRRRPRRWSDAGRARRRRAAGDGRVRRAAADPGAA